jgi:diaminopimelate decarboxylase
MSNHFEYREGRLFAEDVSVPDLANRYGTPLYIYSAATLRQHLRAWQDPLGDRGMICYAVKANSNLGVLSLVASMGGGFDIVSGGELHRVLMAGGDPTKVVFSGVGKTAAEMKMALNAGIHCFNVESESELELLNRVAGELRTRAPVSIRVNPDVDAKTHPYISTGLSENKFGVDINLAPAVYARAAELPNIKVVGVDCHIGSQLTELSPYWDALDRVLKLVDSLESQGIGLAHIDLGGGLGVTYKDEVPPHPSELYQGLFERLGNRPQQLIFEPGRSIAANAGVLVTRVLVTKETPAKNFAVVDAAMNDMLRPALYQSWMNIEPVEQPSAEVKTWEIVGPICESADFLGKQRELALAEGGLLCLFSAGAYGFSMSSNYNSRPRAAEIMVSGDQSQLTRERESLDDLIVGEHRFRLQGS